MSLIADALKTAQRERQRNTTGAAPVVPLLVPLRSQPVQAPGWRRGVTLAASGLAIVIAAAFVAQRSGLLGRESQSRAAAVASLMPADTLVARSATVASARPALTTAHAPSPARAASVGGAAVATRRVTPTAVARTPVQRVVAPPQIRDTAPSPIVAQQAIVPRESVPSGRLRIAVEEPRDADAQRLFEIGVAAHRNGDLAGARNAYEAALAIAPDYVDALNNMGLVLLAQGDAGRAEVFLRRAISLAPRNAGAWNNLGTVLRTRGRTNEAIAAFQHALNLDQRNQMARVSLAQQYVAIGSLDQARALLVEATAGEPDLPEAQYTLGQVLEQQGDKVGAIHAFREFLRIAPPRLSVSAEQVRAHLATLVPTTP